MNEPLLIAFLRVAGIGLILLAALHIPIAHVLKWKEDCARLTPANASIFFVHTIFICAVVSGMGLLCLIDPAALLIPSRAGLWLSGFFTFFWGLRTYAQGFIFPRSLHLGMRRETLIHYVFLAIWIALTATFGSCWFIQLRHHFTLPFSS